MAPCLSLLLVMISSLQYIGTACPTTAWSTWTECSVSCGVGLRSRYSCCQSTKCNTISSGDHCLFPGNEVFQETETCVMSECGSSDGSVKDPTMCTPWSTWSSCGDKCGCGTRYRSRECDGPGYPGPQISTEAEACQSKECSTGGGDEEIDPCAAILCPKGSICLEGRCEPIVDEKCAVIRCISGYMCQDGLCVPREPVDDSCAAVTCPTGTTCTNGECVFTGCPPDQPQVYCLVDPCTVSTCEKYANATCSSNYCGGCNAVWMVDGQPVKC